MLYKTAQRDLPSLASLPLQAGNPDLGKSSALPPTVRTLEATPLAKWLIFRQFDKVWPLGQGTAKNPRELRAH
jgi:hypothetical protein